MFEYAINHAQNYFNISHEYLYVLDKWYYYTSFLSKDCELSAKQMNVRLL